MQCLHKNREEKSDFLIFALENSKELGRKIAEKLKTNLSEIFVRRFADKEIYVKIETSVRGKNVFLIKSTSPPVNENLIELLITIDALKRGSAKSINLVLPYYGYSRQDRKEGGREAITGKLVANLLVRAGITRLLTFELHAPQIQGFFDIPVDDLRATQDLLTCFLEKNEKKEKKIDLKEIVVVTPDVGGIKRAIRWSNFLKTKIAIIYKMRTDFNHSKAISLIGNVKKKFCLLVDDILDTGTTLINSIKKLKKKGASGVSLLITHALFSKNSALKFKEMVEKGFINEIFITDTVKFSKQKQFSKVLNKNWITVVSVADFISEMIEAIINNSSLTDVYEKRIVKMFKKINSLKNENPT